MRKFVSAAVAITASSVIAASTVGLVTTSASAATQSLPAASSASSAAAAKFLAAPRKKKSMKLSLNRGYQHFMQTPDSVVAKVKGAKGKVSFSVDGTSLGKVKLKKGTAKIVLPTELAVGSHTIKAKLKKAKLKASKKITVYSGGVMPNATEFTVSKSSFDRTFTLAGGVTWKGQPGQGGYVDLYKAPYVKGSTSPDYLCMASVDAGAFNFNGFCSGFDELPVGDYQMQAFYTQDYDYFDYVTGAPIVVHIVP